MFEKDMHLVLLLDVYGELLGEHRRDMLEMYYCEDLSLSEIAENSGISRQAVRESIKKGETELRMYEEKLHLAERSRSIRARCAAEADIIEAALPEIANTATRQSLAETVAYLRSIPL